MPRVGASIVKAMVAVLALANSALGQTAGQMTKPTIAPIVDRGPHKVEYGKNYKIIRMHHPRSQADSISGPSFTSLREEGVIILNYSDRTDPASLKQLAWLEEALPAFAARSKEAVILIDITAMDKDRARNVLYTAFMPSLLILLEKFNTLDHGKPVAFDRSKDDLIIPYAKIFAGKGASIDFSVSLYPRSSTDQQLRAAVLSNVIRAIRASNEASQRRN